MLIPGDPRKFSSEFPGYGRMSVVSLAIMSTTKVAIAVRRWEQQMRVTVRVYMTSRVNHFRARNSESLRVWGRESRVCVSARPGLDLEKLSRKSAQDRARVRFAVENVNNLTVAEHFWTMRSAKRAQDCSDSSILRKKATEPTRSE